MRIDSKPSYPVASSMRWVFALLLIALVQPAHAILDVNKSFTPISVPIGGSSVVEITLFNSSQSFPVTAVAFTDVLPGAGSIVATSVVSNSCGGSVVIVPNTQIALSGGTVPQGAGGNSGVCSIQVLVTAGSAGTFVNTIDVGDVSGIEDGSPISNPQAAEATLIVAAAERLSGTKTHTPGTGSANSLHVGGTGRITITISNPNAFGVTGVGFTDNLPAPLMVQSPPNVGGTCVSVGGGTVTAIPGAASFDLTGAAIAAGGSCTVQVDFTVNPTQANVFRNGNVSNSIPAGGIVATESLPPSLAFSRSIPVQTGAEIVKAFAPASVAVGGTSTLTLTLRNFNTTPIVGADFTDVMPAGITVLGPVSTTCSPGTAGFTPTEVSIVGATIPAAPLVIGNSFGSCIITAIVEGSSAGAHTNSIPAGNLAGIGYPARSAVLTVSNEIGLNKAFAPASILQGGTSTATITLSNSSGVPASILNFSDDFGTMGTGLSIVGVPTTTCPGSTVGVAGLVVSLLGGSIPAAGSCTLTVVLQAAANAGVSTRTNTIPAGTLQTSLGNVAQARTATLVINRVATLNKSFLPPTVAPGGISRMRLQVVRATGAPVFNAIDIIDNLPTGHVVATPPNALNGCGGSLTATAGSGSVSLSGGTLAAANCIIEVDIQAPVGVGSATNSIPSANFTVLAADGNTYRHGSAVSATLTRRDSTVQINKAFVPVTINGGGSSQVQILINNNQVGNMALSGVELTDTLPANVVVAGPASPAFSGSGCALGSIDATPGNNFVTLSGASIAAGSICTLTFNATSSFDGNHINGINAGAVSSREGVSNPDPVSATLTIQRNVGVQKWFTPAAIPSGGTSLLTIRIFNTNESVRTFTPSGVVDTLPAGVLIAAAPAPTQTCSATNFVATAGTGTITVGGFPLASNSFCEVTVPVTAAAPGSYLNVIAAGSVETVEGSTNPDPAQDTLVVLNTPTIAKAFSPASIPLGATSTITFTLGNSGAVALTNASFTDTFPAGMQINASASAGGTCVGASGNFFFAGDTVLGFSGLTIPASGSCTVTVVVTTTATGSFPNTTSGVSSNETPDPGPPSNEATLTVVADRPTIAKSFAPNPIPLGDTSDLTFTLGNTNDVALTIGNAGFTDTFPSGMVVASPVFASTTCVGAVQIRNLSNGTLVAGNNGIRVNNGSIPASSSCTVTVRVTTLSAGSFDNVSSTLATTNGGSSLTGASDTLVVTPPVLTTTKSVDPPTLVLGGTATYTVTVSNSAAPGTGRVLSGFTLLDDLAFDITLLDTTGSDPGWSCVGTSSLSCAFVGSLIPGASTTLLLNVAVGEAAVTGDNIARVVGGGDPFCPSPPAIPLARCEGQVTASTVPVVLSRVHARVENGELIVQFATITEMGTLGFRVLTGSNGARDQAEYLSENLQRGGGADPFAPREYEVRGPYRGESAVWIEETTLSGRTIAYGPFPLGIEVGGAHSRAMIDWPAIRAEQALWRTLRPLPEGAATAAEIGVRTDGVLVVDAASLLAAGVNFADEEARRLVLRRNGESVPFEYTGPALWSADSQIRFLGEAVAGSLYTDRAVYRLELDPSVAANPLASVHAVPTTSAPQANVAATMRHAPNRLYAPYAGGDDPWYAAEAFRNGAQIQPIIETVNLPDRVPAAGERLRLTLWGGTILPEAPDHGVRVLVNGSAIGERYFDGLDLVEFEFLLPSGLLLAGANTIRLEPIESLPVPYDLFMLEHIEIDYRRGTRAVDDAFEIRLGDNVDSTAFADRILAASFESMPDPACAIEAHCDSYAIGGFSRPDIVVYRQRDGRVEGLNGGIVEPDGAGGFRIRFSTTRAAGDLLRVEVPQAANDLAWAPALADPLAGGPASLLMIAHPSFVSGLDPLIAARQAEGFTVRVVSTEAIYRRYSHGVFDPTAIRAAIRDAHLRLGTRYVLLVGGDSYDYFDYGGWGSISFVPTHYRRTDPSIIRFGPADGVHGDLDGDDIPELAIGRFPVRTLAELAAAIDKTLAYSSAPHAARALLVADRADPTDFAAQLATLGDSLPGWNLTEVRLDDYPLGSAGTSQARAAVKTAVDAGQSLLAYMGHSGPDRWTFSGLLNAQQIYGGLFANAGRPTVVWNLGCYGSYFTQPQVNSVAHAFMLSGQTGAAAVLGSSGLTAISSDIAWMNLMSLYLYDERIGDALRESQRLLHTLGPQYMDISLGANLLGDPTLRVRR